MSTILTTASFIQAILACGPSDSCKLEAVNDYAINFDKSEELIRKGEEATKHNAVLASNLWEVRGKVAAARDNLAKAEAKAAPLRIETLKMLKSMVENKIEASKERLRILKEEQAKLEAEYDALTKTERH